MWRLSFPFGGSGSSWNALLCYAARSIAEAPDQISGGAAGRLLEEAIGLHLQTEWSNRHGDPLAGRTPQLPPRYVRAAEEYIHEHAHLAPTLTEVADAVGVSVRTLTSAFRRYRGQAPIALMREIRMNGVRADLLRADSGQTVASVLSTWGYVNQGVFCQAYRRLFGELPSATLRRPPPRILTTDERAVPPPATD